MMVCGLIVSSFSILLGLVFYNVLIWILAKIPLRKCKLLFFAIIFITLISIGTQSMFYTERSDYVGSKTILFYLIPCDVPIIGKLPVTLEGIKYGVMLSMRFTIFILVFMIVPFTTHPSKMILVLQKVKLPNWLILMFTMSLRFIPLTFQNFQIIRNAQKLRRGKLRFRDVTLLFGTLIITSLRTAKEMAIALDSKAFRQNTPRTSLKTINFARKDVLFCMISISILIAILIEIQVGVWNIL